MVEQRHVGFTPREHLIDDGQIADHERQKSKAGARLDHRQRAGQAGVRDHVAETERKERGATEVQGDPEITLPIRHAHRRAGHPLQDSEADHQDHRPNPQQEDH